MELLNIKDDENVVQEVKENEILVEDDNDDSITVKEARQVMKNMTNGKASGDGGTPFVVNLILLWISARLDNELNFLMNI